MGMQGKITLAQKVDILFRRGKQQGIDTTYHAIGDATGETWTNIMKIRKGENANPGLRTAEGLARYFGVNLDYFQCSTEAECWAYVSELSERSILETVRMRARNLSPEAAQTLDNMIKSVLQFMEQVDSAGRDPSEDA
jgi:transcriptional regulator with XRE-family HTH domain